MTDLTIRQIEALICFLQDCKDTADHYFKKYESDVNIDQIIDKLSEALR